jgi:hypothetical protein
MLSGVCNSGSNPKGLSKKKQMTPLFYHDNLSTVNEIRIMSDGGYKIRNKKEIHFVTFAVVEWIDVFTGKNIEI